MDKRFLYKKPNPIGVLDDSDVENDDLASWFLDDSRDVLKNKFEQSPIDELVIELADIFREGDPNFQTLAWLFGSSHIEEDNEEKIMIWRLHEIERTNEDIIRVEMHVDPQSLILRKLYLYVQMFPPLQLIKNKLNDLDPNIAFQETSDGFVIVVRECEIAILKNISQT
ncbi:hypothetical protein ACFO25_00535 [Paenactinomyces guangxiensis]|uniref:Uncharacterized protein n=1 Tax=Paenactinomyces guangxiensis TaxID=1490290 RepID=A0A7W1WSG2_9BACL|nr:hypothetical protein [Paenactinomyces guangxiensis]MBA4495195.1 hypothetical protein [Paenactinomyces guangxiensis]MBH8592279.1 hypothetical protein [Paenactinomyces guangxiensis]